MQGIYLFQGGDRYSAHRMSSVPEQCDRHQTVPAPHSPACNTTNYWYVRDKIRTIFHLSQQCFHDCSHHTQVAYLPVFHPIFLCHSCLRPHLHSKTDQVDHHLWHSTAHALPQRNTQNSIFLLFCVLMMPKKIHVR